jgi:hypothetical protein
MAMTTLFTIDSDDHIATATGDLKPGVNRPALLGAGGEQERNRP